jgi:S1-C subfamily serine protease
MDMSETWPPTAGSDDPQSAGTADDETTAPSGTSIPLGPAQPTNPFWVERPYTAPEGQPISGQLSPESDPTGQQPPTGMQPPVGQQPPFGQQPPTQPPFGSGQYPTNPNPWVGGGTPTPPAGTWPAPPGPSWGPGAQPGVPFGGGWPGGAGGTTPPYGGWPSQAPMAPAPSNSSGRKGLVATVAALVLVVAVLAGVGLGHAVWSSPQTTAAAINPGTGSSGSSGSSGSENPAFGGGSTGSSGSPFGSGSSSGSSSTGAGAPSDISAIAAKVDPGLVDINTNLSYEDEQAAGTGMVLTSDGVILTNNHVIDGATSISVTDIGNGKTYTGNVVGYDRTGDVAVVKLVNASGLQTVTTSNAAASVGQSVVGIGNAGGTGGTPSTAGGSITALNQSITASDDGGGNSENLSGLIEINAGIEPGDSGGALVNASGQVLGMDTAASEDSGLGDSGTQAYAIPIGTALSVAKKIEAGKASSVVHIGATGFLGVSVQDSSSASTGSGSGDGGFGGSAGGFGGGTSSGTGGGTGSDATGAVVESVLASSAAGQAGVVAGDVITGLNGSTVSTASDLSNLLEPQHPGDVVHLQWTDSSGQSHTASVTLATGPPA